MKKLTFITLLIISIGATAQKNAFVETALTGNGVLIGAGFKIYNIKTSAFYNFSPSAIHTHFIALTGYQFKMSSYEDYAGWEHTWAITPSFGYSVGNRKYEDAKGVYNAKENAVLYQIELSYRVSNLEIYINTNKTNAPYFGAGFRGHF